MKPRYTLAACAVVLATGLGYSAAAQQKPAAGGNTVTVYKSPT
jgi:hypothetical protein